MSPYASALIAGMRRSLGAPAELAVRTGFYTVILIVFASLWEVAVAANDGAIAGYDYTAMLWYIAVAEAAVIATKPRMIEDIGTDIGTGAIAVEMLRPISVVGFRLAAEMGEALVRFLAAATVAVLFVSWRTGPPPDLGAAIVAAPAAMMAVGVNLAAQHAFAGAAFWLEDAKASWFLYQKLIFLLGGMLLPLELFPTWLSHVARFLPFWAMSYAPARLVSGHLELHLLLVQLGWLVLMLVAALQVFSAGERRLQVVGG